MFLTDGTRIHDLETGYRKRRFWIALAERMQRTDFLDQLKVHFVQTHFGIDVQRRDLGTIVGPPRHYTGESTAKFIDPRLAQSHTCGTRMPAEPLQHLPTGG